VQLSFANGELKPKSPVRNVVGTSGREQTNGQLHFDTASGHLHLIVELIALSRGAYNFNWTVAQLNSSLSPDVPLESIGKKSSSVGKASGVESSTGNGQQNRQVGGHSIGSILSAGSRTIGLMPANCSLQCPEQRVCLSLEQLCDEIANCPVTAWDESPQVCEARARNELSALILTQPIAVTTNTVVIDQEQHVQTLPVVISQHWLQVILPVFVISLICISALVFHFRSTLSHKWLSRSGAPSQAPLHQLSTVASSSSSSSGSSCCGMGSGSGPCNCLRPLPFTTKKGKHLKHSSAAATLVPSTQPLFSTNALHSVNSSQLTSLTGKGFSALADYVSTQEFQFELNQERLSSYERSQSSQQTLPHHHLHGLHHAQTHQQQPQQLPHSFQHTLQQQHLFSGHHHQSTLFGKGPSSMYNPTGTVRPPPAYRSSIDYNETTSLSNDSNDLRHDLRHADFNEFGYPSYADQLSTRTMNRELTHSSGVHPDEHEDDESEYGGANHIYQQPSYLSLQRNSRHRPDLLHDSQLGHYAIISTPPPLPPKSPPPPIPPPPIALSMYHPSSGSSSGSSVTSGVRGGTLALHSRPNVAQTAPFRTMRKPV
jgi:hypothetical protein